MSAEDIIKKEEDDDEDEIVAKQELEATIQAAQSAPPEEEIEGLGATTGSGQVEYTSPFYHLVRPSYQPKQYQNAIPQDIKERLLFTYFAIKGLGEVPRLILAEVGAHYDTVSVIGSENQRIAMEWRSRSPNGLLPMLSGGGKIPLSRPISQSGTIIRFLARHFGLNGTTEEETCLADILYETAKDMNQQKDLIASESPDKELEVHKKPFALALRVEKMLERMPNPQDEDAALNYGQIQFYYVLQSCEARRAGCVQENLGPTLDNFRCRMEQRKGIADYLQSSKVNFPRTKGELGLDGGYKYHSGPIKRGDIM